MELNQARLELDPTVNDPITALGGCADLISYCVGADVTLDTCVESARSCSSNEPWREPTPCCPSPCKASFADARRKGTEALTAFESVFFDAPDCFPGVRSSMELP